MKTIKFKNKKTLKLQIRNKMFVIVLLSILLIVFFLIKISRNISFNLHSYLQERINKENLIYLKTGFSYLKKEEVDLNNLITVTKNSKEEIVEVNFNMKECTLILSNIVGYVNDSISNYNYSGYRLDIPIGIISNNVLLRNIGPKIPIKVEVGDIAMGDISTEVKDFGINNALVEIRLSVTLNTSILYPFDTISTNSTYTGLISSKIITGKVPDFYNGTITSKSETISLPINE